MKTITLQNLDDTKALADQIAGLVRGKVLTITLDGDLGAGKTTWTQFFGRALGVKKTINSPTFTIMKPYKQADGMPLYHFDAYRLEGAHQDLGFEERFEEGLCVVEWADFIRDQLPADHLEMKIEGNGDQTRTVTLIATGPEAQKVLEGLE